MLKLAPLYLYLTNCIPPRAHIWSKEYGLLLHLAFNIETVLTCYGLVILLQTMVE